MCSLAHFGPVLLLQIIISISQARINLSGIVPEFELGAFSVDQFFRLNAAVGLKEQQNIQLMNYQSKYFTDYKAHVKSHMGTILEISNGTVLVSQAYLFPMPSVHTTLQCRARCPVQWKSLPVQTELQSIFSDIEVTSYRQYDLSSNTSLLNETPKINWYISNLILKKITNEIQGEYICECIFDPTQSVKLLVGIDQRFASKLGNAGKVLNLTAGDDAWVLLPCAVNSKYSLPHLYVQDKNFENTTASNSNVYVRVSTNSSIVAVPILGYKLNTKELPWSYNFLWICSTSLLNASHMEEEDLNETIRVYILPRSESDAGNFEAANVLVLPMRGKIACCRTDCVEKCHSKRNRRAPRIDFLPMRNGITAALLGPLIHRRAVERQLNRNTVTEEIINSPCVRSEIQFNKTKLEHNSPVYELNCEPKQENASDVKDSEVLRPCLIAEPPPSVDSGFTAVCQDRLSNSTARVLKNYFLAMTPGKTIREDSNSVVLSETLKITIPQTWPIFFNKDINYDAVQVFRKNRLSSTTPKNLSRDGTVPSPVTVKGKFAGNEFIPEGSHLCLLCEAIEYLHSNAILWSIEFENGSRIFQKKFVLEESMNRNNFVDDSGKDAVQPRITSIFCTKTLMGMVGVECHAPIWNSYDRMTTAYFKTPTVLSRSTPVINCSTVQNFTIYLRDELEISCTVTSIIASLEIQWLQNGKLLDSYVENYIAIRPKAKLFSGFVRDTLFAGKEKEIQMGVTERTILIPSQPPITVSIIRAKLSSKCNQHKEYNDTTSCNSQPFLAGNYTFRVISGNTSWEEYFAVNVKETIPPRILGNNTDQHTLMLGEMSQDIRCEGYGDPLPELIWERDNEPIPDTIQVNSTRLTRTSIRLLRFPVVGYGAAGEYVCRARNRFGEESTQRFQVLVSGPPNRTMLVAVSLSASFLIVILILVYRFYRRQNIEKLKLIQLEKDFWKGLSGNEDQESGDIRNHFLSLPYISEKFEIDPANLKIVAELNSGSFGVVHEGELRSKDSELITRVAIKSPAKKNFESMESVCCELKIVQQIKQLLGTHENVVEFFGAITKDFQKYKICLVMEYCEKGSIEDYISEHKSELIVGRMDGSQCICPRTLKWAEQIANGMSFLSENKIIHVDLAARNVFLTADETAKVGDFGLSKFLHANKGYYANRGHINIPSKWTAVEGFVKGDVQGKLSAKSDVWSYGITLWEIFTLGKEPDYSCSDAGLVENLLERGVRLEKPDFADIQTYCLMRQCWHPDPDKRPTFPMMVLYFQDLYERTIELSLLRSGFGYASPSHGMAFNLNPVQHRYVKQNMIPLDTLTA